MVGSLEGRTVGGDKGYDVRDFASGLRAFGATPHVAQHQCVTTTVRKRRSTIERRTTLHAGYATSQRRRKRIEEAFGWIKAIAGQAKTGFQGFTRVGWPFPLAAAAYNLIRLPKPLGHAA